mmetsp:Transcript_11468/g.28252  ORF Transcript_11468/g.28252 Transcript_11468/m.28252 type:complete len:218 (+) Transcript_11468:75-728(+)
MPTVAMMKTTMTSCCSAIAMIPHSRGGPSPVTVAPRRSTILDARSFRGGGARPSAGTLPLRRKDHHPSQPTTSIPRAAQRMIVRSRSLLMRIIRPDTGRGVCTTVILLRKCFPTARKDRLLRRCVPSISPTGPQGTRSRDHARRSSSPGDDGPSAPRRDRPPPRTPPSTPTFPKEGDAIVVVDRRYVDAHRPSSPTSSPHRSNRPRPRLRLLPSIRR